MGFFEEWAAKFGLTEEEFERRMKKILKVDKPPKGENKPENQEFIRLYCEEFQRHYRTNPPIDGKTAGLAKTIVKDLGLAEATRLMVTYMQMRRRDFVLKHHDLGTFKLNLNAVRVQADHGRSFDQHDAKHIGLQSHNQRVVADFLKEKECKNNS